MQYLIERFPAHSIKGLRQINKSDKQWFSLSFVMFFCRWRSVKTISVVDHCVYIYMIICLSVCLFARVRVSSWAHPCMNNDFPCTQTNVLMAVSPYLHRQHLGAIESHAVLAVGSGARLQQLLLFACLFVGFLRVPAIC